MTPDRAEALDLVYNARGADDLRRGYDGWAADYDADMDRRGYVLPGFAAAMVARHVAPGEGPILDAGAGTGLLGERLARAGHRDLVALDLSEGMLEAAARRGVYRAVRRAALGEPLDFADGHFRAVVSAGAFGARHAPAGGLRELIRVARPGGHLVVTVRRLGMEEAGFPGRDPAPRGRRPVARDRDGGPLPGLPGRGRQPLHGLGVREDGPGRRPRPSRATRPAPLPAGMRAWVRGVRSASLRRGGRRASTPPRPSPILGRGGFFRSAGAARAALSPTGRGSG